jgi:hypothetical protein
VSSKQQKAGEGFTFAVELKYFQGSAFLYLRFSGGVCVRWLMVPGGQCNYATSSQRRKTMSDQDNSYPYKQPDGSFKDSLHTPFQTAGGGTPAAGDPIKIFVGGVEKSGTWTGTVAATDSGS